MLGIYADDCLFEGSQLFNDVICLPKSCFESKPVEWDSVEFLGVRITKECIQYEVLFEINQIGYINKLTQIPSNSDFDTFRSLRACMSWVCHSRPGM